MRVRSIPALTFLAASLAALPAEPAFHLMNIVEVFPGTAAAPNAQYIVLQMWSQDQNFVDDHVITVYDRTGAPVATFQFTDNVANGQNQRKILVATAEAADFFDVPADLVMMSASIPVEGGKICFEVWDCVAWGNYAPVDAAVGTPFKRPDGLALGRAMIRRLDVAGAPTVLEGTDDTNNSANDFVSGTPAPRNNANVSGVPRSRSVRTRSSSRWRSATTATPSPTTRATPRAA